MSIQRRLQIFAGRDAPLYHWMNMSKAFITFSNDELKALFSRRILGRGISLTRNKHYKHDSDSSVKLILNQTKIRHNHKLIPLDAEFQYHFNDIFPKKSTYENTINQNVRDRVRYTDFHNMSSPYMAEEFLVGDLKSLHSYLLGIQFQYRWSDDRFMTSLAEYTTKYSIPLTIYAADITDWKKYRNKFAKYTFKIFKTG